MKTTKKSPERETDSYRRGLEPSLVVDVPRGLCPEELEARNLAQIAEMLRGGKKGGEQ